jgi:Tfp pilus assembly protein PilO
MNKSVIKRKLLVKKATDYSYTILFFISFAFFTFFVIRPNILTILSLQEEAGKLHILDTGYENVIQKIVDIQSFLQENGQDLYLLDESLPSIPKINKLVLDTQYSASSSGINLTSLSINKVDLRDTEKKLIRKKISITLDGGGDFTQSKEFITQIMNNRRLKMIQQITFDQDEKKGSESGSLKLLLEVEGYYL